MAPKTKAPDIRTVNISVDISASRGALKKLPKLAKEIAAQLVKAWPTVRVGVTPAKGQL